MYRKCQVSKIIDLLNMKRQYFYSSLIFSILVFRALVFADGGMVIWPPPVHLDQTAQNAIVAWNGEEEIIILSNDIKSDSKATVLRIVPLPSNPTEIKEADPNCFEKLVELMNEKLKAIMPPPPGYPAPPDGIEIIFHEKIGAHDVTVVKVNNLDYFLNWIKNFAQAKGLQVKEISQTFKDGVANYLKRQIEYFVFDVIEPEAGEESIKPLIYRFNSDSLYYPLLISGISEIRESEAKINLFLITPKEAVIFNPPYSYYRYGWGWFYSYVFGELTEEELQEVSEDLRDLFEGPVKARMVELYGRLNQITRDLSLYPSHFWDKDLTLGSSGQEVKALQKILINEGVWDSDLKATGYFGPVTKNALAKFQEKYLGYMIGSGYFDPETKEYLKKLSIKFIKIYVDAVNGDDNNNGLTPEAAFATIQKGINTAEEGYTVLVYPGVYQEELDFLGKAITVKSAEDAAVLEAPGGFAVAFYSGEEPNSVLKNFVIRNSLAGIFVAGSSPTISNVTVVDNEYGVAAVWAEPDISSSIFWNNIYGDLYGCQARYSCIERGSEGEDNLNINPLFADPNNADYHLLSQRGRYWPEHDKWVLDDVISPCIDGGDPNSDYSNERKPNGERINMGAYGGTAYASMKEMRWNPCDINHDGWVNFIDFATLAEDWLTYQPGTSNIPPKVNITSPEDGASFDYHDTVEIWADANDIDGLVRKVEFLANGSKIGEDNDGTDGWKTNWNNHPVGSYSLTAKATDDKGATTTSPPVGIIVESPPKPFGCFPADTLVWVDGKLVQISKVVPGQKVGKLGGSAASLIEGLQEHGKGLLDCYDMVLESGNVITVVHSHYFLTVSGRWVAVENLTSGSKLQSLNGPISIISLVKRTTLFTDQSYNLEVKGSDRYFVGKDGVVALDCNKAWLLFWQTGGGRKFFDQWLETAVIE